MRTKSKFFKIYFAVIIVFVVLLIAGLIALYVFLNSYENAQPSTIVNTIVNDYLKTGNIDELKKDYKFVSPEYETDENVKAVLKKYFSEGKNITASHNAIKPADIDESFVIKVDDEKVLNIYMKKKTVGSGYNVSYIEINKNLFETIEITAPKGVKLTVNGVEVNDDVKVDNELPTLPSKIDTKTLTITQTATISNLLKSDPVVKAYDGDTELTVNCDGSTYTVTKNIDETIASKVQSTAKNAAIAYTAYMQKDGSLGTLATYCDTSCDFYKNVASTLVQFVKSHNGYKDTDFEIGDVVAYSDALYSCRIKYKHTLLLGSETYTDVFDKVIFVTKSNDTYKVVDMQNAASTETE